MALSDTRTKVVYEPDGQQKRFVVPFQVFDEHDVECIAVDKNGAQTRITAFAVHDMQSESGPCVFFDEAPRAGVTLVVRRNTRPVHETEYPEGGTFPSRSVERDLSRITAMIQELNEVVDRSIKVNAGEERPPESAEELYLRITQIALAASDAVRESGLGAEAAVAAASRAGEAAAEARASGQEASAAAEAAAAVLAQITGFAVEVVTIDCYDAPYGEYDAQSGALLLYLPFCQNGGQGNVFLSDALDGGRGMQDGVAASEWALAQAYARAEEAGAAARAAQAGADVALETARKAGAFTGDIRLTPYRAGALPFGWYFCNGNRYAVDSEPGKALAGLTPQFRSDWKIAVDANNTINLPNMFHSDGRGYFIRSVNGTARQAGSVEADQMRPITGTTTRWGGYSSAGPTVLTAATGAFSTNTEGRGNIVENYALTGVKFNYDTFNSALLGTNYSGADTHPLNIGMTPAIYLGV